VSDSADCDSDPECGADCGKWYVAAFRHDYIQRYAHRDDGLGTREAKFALRALKLIPGARLLDLCCGAGRHSRALAKAGLAVTGVDLSEDLLHAARTDSKGLNIEYLRADMRAVPLHDNSMDGVVSLFTSFGYFAAETENERVITEVTRVLKPGGRYLFDFFNRAATLRGLVRESRQFAGGVALRERRWYDAKRGRLNKLMLRGPYDRQGAILESVRAYAPSELRALLERAGLTLVAQHGDLNGAAFDARNSPRCVLVAEKGSGA